jgi:prevent-host-death family protein
MKSMRKVNIHEAKTTLSQLIEAAEAGERVVIARAGTPVVELVGLRRRPKGIRLGTLRGKLPAALLDDAAKPLTQQQLSELFGGKLEP